MIITLEMINKSNTYKFGLIKFYNTFGTSLNTEDINSYSNKLNLNDIQWLIANFKLTITIKIENTVYKYKNGLLVYHKNSNSNWEKHVYNSNGLKTYSENSNGFWIKTTYNSKGLKTSFENSRGNWEKYFYNSKNELITIESSIKTKYFKNNMEN